MLYIDQIDDTTVRFSDEPDGAGNVRMVAIPVESRKEVDGRIWMRQQSNIENVIANYNVEDIVFDGGVYASAESLVVAMNAQIGALLNQFDYYVDSVNGDDANDGLSQNTALKSISALPVINDGDRIGLAKDSVFYETLLIDNAPNIVISSYGIGDNPVIDGSSEITTPTLSSGDVWQTTNTYVGTAGRIVIFEDGIAMMPVANETECEALAGSYVAVAGDSMAGGEYTVKFHPSDSGNPTSNGKLYITNLRECIKSTEVSINTKFKDIEARYGFGESTMMQLGKNGLIENCKARWGNKHNVRIAANSVCRNTITYGSEIQGEYGRTATYFVSYTSVANEGDYFSFIDCVAINNLEKTGKEKGIRITGFLAHAGTNDFTTENITRCYTKDIGTPVAMSGGTTNIEDCFFEGMVDMFLRTTTDVANISNTYFICAKTVDSAISTGICNFENSVIVAALYSQTIGKLVFDNCVLFNLFPSDADYTAKTFIHEVNMSEISTYNTVLMNYVYGICTVSGNYEGDYNVFHTVTGGIEIRNKLDGVQKTTLADWQSATGQDSNSVYVTDSQAATFFTISPETGDTIVNPNCEVTWADGTVHTNQFADGTLITDKVTNKQFSSRRSNYIDHTE